MSWSDRTPELAILALVALLVGAGALLGGGGGAATEGGGSPRAGAAGAARVTSQRIERIERRVERLRGLRFRRPVGVEVVSPAQARRVGLAEMRRSEPPARRRASEELLKLLGLLPPQADAGRIMAAIFAEQVAGFYDPRDGRLALVRGAGVDDITLAHELTHALEDQHFDLERLGDGPGDDRSTAEQALAEGTATLVMERYAARWPSETPVGDALAGLTQVTSATPLPAYTMRSLIFPYIQGERFVSALREAGGGDWRLVDVALRDRPPTTSAEILEPDRWLRAQQPAHVALGATGPLRTAGGWRRLTSSTLGAEDLAALLAIDSGPLAARELTAGWRGGRYALWRRGPLPAPGCAAPCRSRDVVQLAVRMRTPAQARALAAALRRWVDALPAGSAAAVRVSDRGAVVHVALAPSGALAQRLVL
jgi:hypothetical protein